MDDPGTGNFKCPASGDHDIGSIGQWFANRLKSLSPHNNMVPAGDALEILQVVRQMPRDLIVDANDAVLRGCNNERNNHG